MYTRYVNENDPAEILILARIGLRFSFLVENFSEVKADDDVLELKLERLGKGPNKKIKAGCDGYILWIGSSPNELFSIAESIEELKPYNPFLTDFSSLSIEKELKENRYYYTLKGIPGNVLDGLYYLRIASGVEPEYELSWLIKVMFLTEDHEKVYEYTIEEPFKVEVKKAYFGQSYTSNDQLVEDGDYYAIKNFAIGYPKRNQLPVINTPESFTPGDKTSACYVYIMRNEDNGAYKIGISNDPKYREHTLQSQEPNVNVIFFCEFPTRDAAQQVESEMHEKYAQYHMRGEWFAIPHKMVKEVFLDVVKRRAL